MINNNSKNYFVITILFFSWQFTRNTNILIGIALAATMGWINLWRSILIFFPCDTLLHLHNNKRVPSEMISPKCTYLHLLALTKCSLKILTRKSRHIYLLVNVTQSNQWSIYPIFNLIIIIDWCHFQRWDIHHAKKGPCFPVFLLFFLVLILIYIGTLSIPFSVFPFKEMYFSMFHRLYIQKFYKLFSICLMQNIASNVTW